MMVFFKIIRNELLLWVGVLGFVLSFLGAFEPLISLGRFLKFILSNWLSLTKEIWTALFLGAVEIPVGIATVLTSIFFILVISVAVRIRFILKYSKVEQEELLRQRALMHRVVVHPTLPHIIIFTVLMWPMISFVNSIPQKKMQMFPFVFLTVYFLAVLFYLGGLFLTAIFCKLVTRDDAMFERALWRAVFTCIIVFVLSHTFEYLDILRNWVSQAF